MLDAAVAALAFAVVVALGMAVLYGVTVVPFLLTVGRAEQRGLATGRWALAAIGAALLALGLGLVLVRSGVGPLWLAPALAVAYLPVLAVASPVGHRLGRAGRHEQPL